MWSVMSSAVRDAGSPRPALARSASISDSTRFKLAPTVPLSHRGKKSAARRSSYDQTQYKCYSHSYQGTRLRPVGLRNALAGAERCRTAAAAVTAIAAARAAAAFLPALFAGERHRRQVSPLLDAHVVVPLRAALTLCHFQIGVELQRSCCSGLRQSGAQQHQHTSQLCTVPF